MGGVKTCSTGCSKNNPEFMDNGYAANRRNKKKTGTKINIESNASMGYSATAKEYNKLGMDGVSQGDDFAFSNDPNENSKQSISNLSNNFNFNEKVISGGYLKQMEEGLKPRILIICLGRREAGLDLHGSHIANSLDLTAVSSRDVIQKAMSSLSDGPSLEVREKIESALASGTLIEDEIMSQLFKEVEEKSHPQSKPSVVSTSFDERNDKTQGFVFCGFPRTQQQARMFNNIIEDNMKYNYQMIVLYFKMTNDDKIIQRAPKYRGQHNQFKKKDEKFGSQSLEEMNKRLQNYRDQMNNVIKFYQAEKYEEESILFEIDADKKANDIAQQITRVLQSKGLTLEKVDPQKMNLWDLNHNQKYTEITQSVNQSERDSVKQQPEVKQQPVPQPSPEQQTQATDKLSQQAESVEPEPTQTLENKSINQSNQVEANPEVLKDENDQNQQNMLQDSSANKEVESKQASVKLENNESNTQEKQLSDKNDSVEELDAQEVRFTQKMESENKKVVEEDEQQPSNEVKADNVIQPPQNDNNNVGLDFEIPLDQDDGGLDFDDEDDVDEISKSLQKSENTDRRSTIQQKSKNGQADNISTSEIKVESRKRKQTVGSNLNKKFQSQENDDDEAVTEIGYDVGNSKLDDQSEQQYIKKQYTQNNALDRQSESSYMMRMDQGDDQSEGSVMMRTSQKLPPGFDDESSDGGFIRKVAIDDMSSQGSFLKKKKKNLFNVESQGSYIERGQNGPAEGQDVFDGDDDDQSDIQLDRGSLYSSEMMNGRDLDDDNNQLKQMNSIPDQKNDENDGIGRKQGNKLTKAQSEMTNNIGTQ